MSVTYFEDDAEVVPTGLGEVGGCTNVMVPRLLAQGALVTSIVMLLKVVEAFRTHPVSARIMDSALALHVIVDVLVEARRTL